jgi:hypothetical protein
MDYEIKNAIIKSATINNEDGFLTIFLTLDYGGSDQGFGGYNLYTPKIKYNSNFSGHFIWRCMEVAGVSRWEKIVGKAIRVKASRGNVKQIGHIVKTIWFDPSAENLLT